MIKQRNTPSNGTNFTFLPCSRAVDSYCSLKRGGAISSWLPTIRVTSTWSDRPEICSMGESISILP